MKTPEQIKAWLEAQPWYEQFKSYTLREDLNYDVKDIKAHSAKVLSGLNDDLTIAFAFVWDGTNEGYRFWDNIDTQFIKWYLDKNPD